MKENINTNIGGIVFHIEKDGYVKLKEYMEITRIRAASYNKPIEMMAFIESRIAETFLNKLKGGIQVVTLEDVEDLIAIKEGFARLNIIRNINYIYFF
jgi:hypothetical protein